MFLFFIFKERAHIHAKHTRPQDYKRRRH